MIDTDLGLRGSGQAILTILVTSLSVVLLPACQGQDSSGEPFTVTDSAGVQIVESVRPQWESGAGWRLSPEPEVVIGAAGGDEKYMLSQVMGVRRLSDGRIAILDAGSERVRLYDSTGLHLMDLGGDGDGPSEFRSPQFLGLVSDTLFVYDILHDNLVWFAPDGRFMRTSEGIRLRVREVRGARTVVFGHLDDRFLIATRTEYVGNQSFVDGLHRDPWPIWRFGLLNTGADSLFSVPGFEEEISRVGSQVRHRTHVFAKFTQLAASKTQVYVAPTDDFSIQVFDQEGALRRIIRRPWTPHRVTSSDVDKWVAGALRGATPEQAAGMRRSVSELSVAETLPALRWIAVDAEDDVWVEEWEGAGFEQGRFAVFRADGAWLGYVDLPDGLPALRFDYTRRLIEIGSDYLLGVWADDLGVEQVRLYRIEKT